jgi:hypothetical protein
MNEANEYASAYGLDPATQHNGSWDAFRHAYSSAAMANEFGADVADAAGWLNELRGDLLHDQPAWEKNMDLWNNSVGREIGTNSNSKDEMAQKVFDALNKGDLINDPLNDDRLYDSFFPKNFNPDDHSTIPSKMQDLLNPKIDPDVNSLWHAFKNWVAPHVDPLVLDLDGDGIETVGISATTHILFDHNNDGIKTGTGWVKGDDGLLVLDRNGNGVIDNGSELFGDSTMVNGVKATDGFSALRAEDTNKNSKFDVGDTNFTTVAVWQDKNQNGISQTNELHTLSELGIKSINLASTATSGWLEGATQTATGTFTRTNGTKGEVGNLNFASNGFYREYLTPPRPHRGGFGAS